MRGRKLKYRITLAPEEKQSLRQLVSACDSPQGKVRRARILRMAFERAEWSNQAAAREAGCTD